MSLLWLNVAKRWRAHCPKPISIRLMLTVHICEPNWRTRCCTQWILRVSLVGTSSNLWTWTRGCLITWWQLDSKQSFLKGPILDLPRHQLFVAVFLTIFSFYCIPKSGWIELRRPSKFQPLPEFTHGLCWQRSQCIKSSCSQFANLNDNPKCDSRHCGSLVFDSSTTPLRLTFCTCQLTQETSSASNGHTSSPAQCPNVGVGARRSKSVYNTIKWSNLLFPHFVSFCSQWHVHNWRQQRGWSKQGSCAPNGKKWFDGRISCLNVFLFRSFFHEKCMCVYICMCM